MARKPDGFAKHVLGVAVKAPAKDLAAALGALVAARLRARMARSVAWTPPTPARATATPAQRRSGKRRLGKFQRYVATGKLDTSRYGTFRRYMISTIRAHTNTRDANTAHATCDNPSFAKNRLDFNWAADNGYITFE